MAITVDEAGRKFSRIAKMALVGEILPIRFVANPMNR
jgi:hypothetical protein